MFKNLTIRDICSMFLLIAIALIIAIVINIATAFTLSFDYITANLDDIHLQLVETKNTVESIKMEPEKIEEPKTEICDTYEIAYFDVPLSKDLQNHIFKLCDSYKNIEPSIIIAMIQTESNYDSSIIGDAGLAFGLMQIHPRWHENRMNELGITDLLDPYQNVKVGIDYLSDLITTGESIEWALMAYNGGPAYANRKAADGEISEYVSKIMRISSEL